MIQRLQSVYLFLSALLLVIFSFTSAVIVNIGSQSHEFGVLFGGTDGHFDPNYLLLTPVCLIIILTLITIMRYKNLKNQLKLCAICLVLTIAFMISIAAFAYSLSSTGEITLTAYNLLPIGSFLLMIMAYKGIAHDKKLISDSERIR